jgi:hypothetical protein
LRREQEAVERIDPALSGLVFLGFVYAIYVLTTGKWRIWLAVNGVDGSASTSKFQFFVWTGVVLFAYATVAAALFTAQSVPELPALPPSVLIVLGISGGTTAAAKLLTVQNIRVGKLGDSTIDAGQAPATPYPETTKAGPLFLSNSGQPDVGKIQLLGFTFLAMAVFLTATFELVDSILEGTAVDSTQLPAINDMFLVLMGFGSATYVGSKWVLTPSPRLSTREPDVVDLTSADDAARTLTVYGSNFGDRRESLAVLIDGVPLQTPIMEFADSSAKCLVPKARPDGTPWSNEKEVSLGLGVTVAGRPCPDALTLVLKL